MSDTNASGGGGIAIGDVENAAGGEAGEGSHGGALNTGLSTSASD